jgi:phosphoglycolate phosphatase
MDFDGLIFDLDGTLWDCSAASAEAYNQTHESFGIAKRVSAEFVQSISGRPSSECDEILLAEFPVELREAALKSFDDLELAAIRRYAPHSLYLGVESGLGLLRARYRLLVVSNCGESYLDVFHRHAPVGGLFSDSESYGRTKRLKHENIRSVVERQGLKCPCYIGDTAGDEYAAALAGVPFFYVSYGFGKPNGVPQAEFQSFEELVGYFGAT